MAALAIVGYSRTADAIITDADFAVGEWYTELATRGELLLGPYSRFNWNHPGPILFYLTAPFYALSGHRAPTLYAVALAINLASIATIMWVVASDRRRWLFAVLLTGGLLLLAFRLLWFLASPWNAHLPVLAVRVHRPGGGGRGRTAVTSATARGVRELRHADACRIRAVGARGRCRRIDLGIHRIRIGPAGVLEVGWLGRSRGPLALGVAGRGSGLAKRRQRRRPMTFFSSTNESGHSVSEAVANFSYGLNGVLRPGLELPGGGHFQLTDLSWAIPAAIAQLVLLATIAVLDLRRDRRFEGWLALTALIASLVGGLSLTRIRGDILNHELLRFTALAY